MADLGIWGLGAIASPAATDRLALESSAGAGGYSERSEFIWRGADGHYRAGGSSNYVLNLTSPKADLSIAIDATNNAGGINIGYSWAAGGQGPLKFSNASGEVARLSPTGNFGVGTTAPATRLHVKSAGEIAIIETTAARGSGNGWLGIYDPTGRKGYFGWGGGTDDVQVANEMNGALQFVTNNQFRWQILAGGALTPVNDNTHPLGGASARCTVIYAATGTINTCDVRFKTFRTDSQLREAEQAAALDLFETFGFFQFNDAIEEKGEDGARWHYGPAAQEAWSVWASHGLADALIENEIGELVPPEGSIPPAFLCFDLIAEETAPVMEGWRPSTIIDPVTDQPVMVKCAEGEEATEMRPTGETLVMREAGHIFGVRIDQLHSIMIAALNAERKAHADRLAALEAA